MNKLKIMVVGDVHGRWGALNKLIDKKSPDIILQCGDFGYWPNFHNTETVTTYANRRKRILWDAYGIKCQNTKIYFCDGNHEDHWELNKFDKPTKIYDNIRYMPRGSSITLPDGRNVLFMGGAESIDKWNRTIGYDWFPEETITQKDIYELTDNNVDIIISHTCPTEFMTNIKDRLNYWVDDTKFIDPSQHALTAVLEKYKPSLWYFGHFHQHMTDCHNNTKWFLLNTIGETLFWRWLEK